MMNDPTYKPTKPFYTVNWLKSCDLCAYAEPHYCLLHGRSMKNMDIKRCRDWNSKDTTLPSNFSRRL